MRRMSTAFDTLQATKVLKGAGFDDAQAEAVVATVGRAVGGEVAMKEHVSAAVAELRAEMAGEFKGLYRHLWVMAAGIVGVTVALVKLIP